jgi:uroporphyrinogen decarboxylase
MEKIVKNLTRTVDGETIPVILFTKGGMQWLETIATTGCDALGLDWTININEAHQRVGSKVALQGNMDPCVLYASPDTIRTQVKQIITDFPAPTGHVFNLGHGIHQHINPEHVKVLVDAVHEFGRVGKTL